MLANPDYKKCNHQLQMIMIAYVYVRIKCICHPLIESIISWSKNQHSMVDFTRKPKFYE